MECQGGRGQVRGMVNCAAQVNINSRLLEVFPVNHFLFQKNRNWSTYNDRQLFVDVPILFLTLSRVSS